MTMSGAGLAWGGVERTLVTNIRSRKLRAVLAWGDQNMEDLGWEGVEGETIHATDTMLCWETSFTHQPCLEQ